MSGKNEDALSTLKVRLREQSQELNSAGADKSDALNSTISHKKHSFLSALTGKDDDDDEAQHEGGGATKSEKSTTALQLPAPTPKEDTPGDHRSRSPSPYARQVKELEAQLQQRDQELAELKLKLASLSDNGRIAATEFSGLTEDEELKLIAAAEREIGLMTEIINSQEAYLTELEGQLHTVVAKSGSVSNVRLDEAQGQEFLPDGPKTTVSPADL